MLFSIVTVCYNSEKTIETTIKSILNQTCQDYEYWVIDGKSTDRTVQIIQQYEPLFQGKLKWISEKDQGIYDAMNKGIAHSSGEIIGILNSDDYYENDALEKIAKAYHGELYCIVYGMIRTMRDGKEVMVYLKNHEFLEEDMIAHPACFITKKLYDKFGKYSLDYPYSADYEFMLRIHKNQEIHFVKLYEILTNFNLDGASNSVRAYRDTLKLKRTKKMISQQKYDLLILKTYGSICFKKIKMLLNRRRDKE